MKKEHKSLLQNHQLTEDLLFSCLATCEGVIEENAKWEKVFEYSHVSRASSYEAERLEWSVYREKIRKVLQRNYTRKKIIALTETGDLGQKAQKPTVKAVVELIDSGDYTLI